MPVKHIEQSQQAVMMTVKTENQSAVRTERLKQFLHRKKNMQVQDEQMKCKDCKHDLGLISCITELITGGKEGWFVVILMMED